LNQCSVNNPSSITTANSITLFSDSSCTKVIQNAVNLPIKLDNQCNSFDFGGSYRAQNLSLVIGLSVGGSLLFLIITICCCVWVCGCCNKRTPAPQTNNAVILDQSTMKIPDYFGNGQNGVQIYPSQQYDQPVYAQNNQYYPNNSYTPQNYTQPVYGSQSYYTPTYPQYLPTGPVPPPPSAPPADSNYNKGARAIF
jgi:hypothetical protein